MGMTLDMVCHLLLCVKAHMLSGHELPLDKRGSSTISHCWLFASHRQHPPLDASSADLSIHVVFLKLKLEIVLLLLFFWEHIGVISLFRLHVVCCCLWRPSGKVPLLPTSARCCRR
jgi:hypothetical protein